MEGKAGILFHLLWQLKVKLGVVQTKVRCLASRRFPLLNMQLPIFYLN